MSNLKISQLEKITNTKEDAFVLAIQNGKNYKMSIKEATNTYIDLSNYYTKEETVDKLNELQNSITSNTDLINTTKTELQNSITSNTDLINTTKTELVGTENTDGTTIWGAKKYTDDLVKNLSLRIDSIVAGGVAFKGVVAALPDEPKNGDLIIMSTDYELGGKTYKKDYEYIYSEGAWYELGDSDKNAKAIAEVKNTADSNATAIQRVETEYKAADTTIKESIKTLSDAAVKSIAGGNSTYVTVSASAKDETGKVTLTVSDTIAATFDTQASVDSKISTAKNALIGNDSDGADASTIKGAKAYTDDLVNGLSTRVDSIVAGGVAFKGVVVALPENPQNGDLIIIGKEGGIAVGDITYKKDYEYIYSNGTWYELGDSDKNAKAIAAVESKANANASAISAMDTAYKAADSALESKINDVSDAAIKSITGGSSNYVTISISGKDDTGSVTLSVSDSITDTFDKKVDVNSKITTAKTDVSNALIGDSTNGSDVDTIWGAKNYAADLVSTLENSFVAITDEEINGLFTA